MKRLSIDLETKSGADIKKEGMYRYFEHPEFEILLFIFSRDVGYPICIDLTAFEEIPEDVVLALWDAAVDKYSYNAPFEIGALGKHFGRPMIISQWFCTMIKAAMCGLPIGLAQVGMALKLDMQKDMLGIQLIRYFCIPCKPTKTNGGRRWNMPWHDALKWEQFKKYGIRDVVVEMKVAEKLEFYTIPDKERLLWFLDQEINGRGVMVDLQLVRNALEGDRVYRERLIKEAIELTGLSNPNSNTQLKEWLELEINEEVTTLKKDAIPDLIAGTNDKVVKRVLEIRQEINKTSVKKLGAMVNTVCLDDRIRGLYQYVGANRTLRFCLAENSPVLIKDTQGRVFEKPIQSVNLSDLVFDGNNWVKHEGVVFSGDKDVITWDGITATKLHNVFISEFEKITLEEAVKTKTMLWKGNI